MKPKGVGPPTGKWQRGAILLKLSAGLARQQLTHRLSNATALAKNLDLIREAKRVVDELGRLKGAAMKLGQMLALEGRDFLPPEVVFLLEKLQNSAPPVSREAVGEILRQELGDRASLLDNFSDLPIAAASIGQVHTATYRGRKVAVKIQYPGIREAIGSDLTLLKSTLGGLVRIFRPNLSLGGIFDELELVLRQEADYQQEAAFAAEYRAFAKNLPGLRVPEVFPEMSASRILTLEYCPGKTIPTWLRENLPAVAAKERLTHRLLNLYNREFLEWGLVQTDPNPGNFLIDPETETLILLDFGATRRYPLAFRKEYASFIKSTYHGESASSLSSAERLKLIDPRESGESREAFFRLASESLAPFRGPAFRFGDPDFLNRMIELSRALAGELKHPSPPREFIFLHRKLSGLYQLLAQLEATVDLRPYLESYLQLQATSATAF
jgi:predicted unusual protein kinase regulating ubiquinone biosynthesis (AarF/ABC1/UbiB family)